MKIALVNENSQASKNALIFETLKKVVEPMGHTCYNYGRYSAQDPHERTYVQGACSRPCCSTPARPTL